LLEESGNVTSTTTTTSPNGDSPAAGPRVLDVGCGDGSFSTTLLDWGLNVVGLDVIDFRGEHARRRLPWSLASFECVASGEAPLPLGWSAPDVIIFKQSFHLVCGGHELLRRAFPRATVVLVQYFARPWDRRRYEDKPGGGNAAASPEANALAFAAAGRAVSATRLVTHYRITKGAAEAFIVGGATSDLRAMPVAEREAALAQLLAEGGEEGPVLSDELAFIIAGPIFVRK